MSSSLTVWDPEGSFEPSYKDGVILAFFCDIEKIGLHKLQGKDVRLLDHEIDIFQFFKIKKWCKHWSISFDYPYVHIKILTVITYAQLGFWFVKCGCEIKQGLSKKLN